MAVAKKPIQHVNDSTKKQIADIFNSAKVNEGPAEKEPESNIKTEQFSKTSDYEESNKTKNCFINIRASEAERDSYKNFFKSHGLSISEGVLLSLSYFKEQVESGNIKLNSKIEIIR